MPNRRYTWPRYENKARRSRATLWPTQVNLASTGTDPLVCCIPPQPLALIDWSDNVTHNHDRSQICNLAADSDGYFAHCKRDSQRVLRRLGSPSAHRQRHKTSLVSFSIVPYSFDHCSKHCPYLRVRIRVQQQGRRPRTKMDINLVHSNGRKQ